MKTFGKGFIAKNFRKIQIPKEYIIYAAGVSNSKLKNKKKYKFEVNVFKKFLKKVSQDKTIIYISTLSVNNKELKNDLYVQNKLIIENLVKKNLISFIILRLPQIVGKNKNKNTLTNSIYNLISKNKEIKLWKGSIRNIIDIDDLKLIIEKYLNNKPLKNSIINIYNPTSIKIENLVNIFEKILIKISKITISTQRNKNINYRLLNKVSCLKKKYYKSLLIKNYYEKTIRKYYA